MKYEKIPFKGGTFGRIINILGQPLLSILAGLFIGAVIIGIQTGSISKIFEVYKVMFTGGFGIPVQNGARNPYYLLATLTRAVPIILCGLGAAFAWRAGYINIGGEGQLVVGGFMTAVAAIYLPFGSIVGIILAIAIGMVCGGLYAWIAAWLDDKFGVFVLITTLMLNYVANNMTAYFVAFPLKDNTGDGIVPKTHMIDSSLRLMRLNWVKGSTFNIGFFIMLVAAAVVMFVSFKTTFGYESRMSGLNKDFAEFGGVKRRKVMYITMVASGALCGLGGALEVLGVKYLYMDNMLKSPSYAWTGLMAALISNLNPVGTLLCSIFLAGLQTGGAAIERQSSIPLEITTIIQAVITLFVSAKLLVGYLKRRTVKKSQTVKGGSGV